MNKNAQLILCNGLLSFFTTIAGLSLADGIPDTTKVIAAFWVAFITASIAALTTWKGLLPPESKMAAAVSLVALALPVH